jgi:hypothetical protein
MVQRHGQGTFHSGVKGCLNIQYKTVDPQVSHIVATCLLEFMRTGVHALI